MLVIGLAGGIASGKSLVARYFSDLGAEVIDADRIGHEVLNDAGVQEQVLATWGDHLFEAGEINRSALSRICLLYTSPSPRDRTRSRMPSSA